MEATVGKQFHLGDREVAILIATYNGAQYINEQLESIQKQTFQDFCCFIHDDGSADDTANILRKFCAAYPDHFKMVKGVPTGGAKYNFMYLLSCINAKYTMFCDQDDIWMPNKIEQTYKKMLEAEQDQTCICVYSDMKVVDSNLYILNKSYFSYTGKNPRKNNLTDILKRNVAAGCTMMIDSELRTYALKLNNINNIYMHDWWIALLAAATGKLVFLDQSLSLYRQHCNNAVGAKKIKKTSEKIKQCFNLKKLMHTKKDKLNIAREFALELSKVIDTTNIYYTFLKKFAEIKNKNKIQRIKFYINNKMLYEHSNKLWQVLWL